jgi:hypothetical protein
VELWFQGMHHCFLFWIKENLNPTKLQMHCDQIADSIFLSFSWIKQIKKRVADPNQW